VNCPSEGRLLPAIGDEEIYFHLSGIIKHFLNSLGEFNRVIIIIKLPEVITGIVGTQSAKGDWLIYMDAVFGNIRLETGGRLSCARLNGEIKRNGNKN
jgi:hypothetical protein